MDLRQNSRIEELQIDENRQGIEEKGKGVAQVRVNVA